MRRKSIVVPEVKYTEYHRWCPINKGMTNRKNCILYPGRSCARKSQCDLEEKAAGE
jgi:hypothetical protein